MSSRAGVKNYRVSFDFYITSGVKYLLIANFAVYIFQAFLIHFYGNGAYNYFLVRFGLVPSAVLPGMRIWQPFTYLFLHDPNSIWHILLNMLMLWMFGR
jgi:membrane associated rhomboid family serine protease